MRDTETTTDDSDGSHDARERVASLFATATTAPFRIVPKRGTIYRKLFGAALKNYHKTGGGDALGLIAEPGQQLDLRPIKYRAPKDCDEGERPGWVEKGSEKVWHAASDGRVVDYIGKTPIVALERDGHVEAGWLKPRIGQAIELDNYQGVFTQPQIQADLVADVSVEANGNATPRALSDGGDTIVDLAVTDLGSYAGAEVVDLDSGDGYDGMRIDFRKASDWAFETTATEEMHNQQERGRLMGMLGAGSGPSVFKLLLLCAAIILGTLAIVLLGPELVGGGGGGASIPELTLLPLGLW